jgi:hypothetical protein
MERFEVLNAGPDTKKYHIVWEDMAAKLIFSDGKRLLFHQLSILWGEGGWHNNIRQSTSYFINLSMT